MSVYVIGDIQGCDVELARLLQLINFNRGVDTAYFLGDLVNRGPDSAAVVRRIMAMGSSARCVAGNHDLHALAVFHGVRTAARGDTLEDLLIAPDAPRLFDWLSEQPLAIHDATHDTLMVHAGVLPQWDFSKIIALGRMNTVTRGQKGIKNMLKGMFGNDPKRWSDDLNEVDKCRVAVNAFTRLRFCTANGEMEFASKGHPNSAPAGYVPWFDVPNRAMVGRRIAFGHWSTLGLLVRDDLLGLDTGCAWGGQLSAAELLIGGTVRIHQVQAG